MLKTIITIIASLTFLFSTGQSELKPEFEKALNLLKSENYQLAEKSFSDVLSKATDTKLKKYCLIYRSFSYNGLRDYKKSIADLDEAIKLDTADLASFTDRGKAKAYANDINGAKMDFQYVLMRDSASGQAAAALYYLGKIAYQENEFEQSVKFYDRFILLIQDDSEVFFNRGAAKDMLMDQVGSIKDYDKAIQLNPNYKEAYANRGVAKINLLRKKGTIQLTKEQSADACSDLKKAKLLGDNAVDDMLFIHCEIK